MRLAVYSDIDYRRDAAGISGDQPFAVFLGALRASVQELTIVGRIDRSPGRWPYTVPPEVRVVALPHYRTLSSPAAAMRAFAGSIRRFWGVLEDVDAVWLLGPHPLALAFALMTVLRRRRVVLGVRQDLVAYVRHRHPGRTGLVAAAGILEAGWRLLARRSAVVAVGPDIGHRYRHARRLLVSSISLVDERELERDGAQPPEGQELRVLSVGRLDPEKNPLMLAEVLRDLLARDERWRLVICGDGTQRAELERRLGELGVADRAELRGHVKVDDGLLDVYRSCHLLLHVSWTEGFPGVLLEAFATRLPVVATAVGGVSAMAGDAATLVAPGDPGAAAAALTQLAADGDLRASRVAAGVAIVRERTLQAETRRVCAFIRGRDA